MHSVRYWIDDAVSINSALDEALKSRSDDFASRAREVLSVLSDATPDSAELQNLLTSVFAMVPHEWKLTTEAEAKRYFLLFMKLAGADIMPESESAQGRADAVLQTARTICIFEFKFAKSARVALRQISTKGYAKPYVADSRRLFRPWRILLLKLFGADVKWSSNVLPSCRIWQPWKLKMGAYSTHGWKLAREVA